MSPWVHNLRIIGCKDLSLCLFGTEASNSHTYTLLNTVDELKRSDRFSLLLSAHLF